MGRTIAGTIDAALGASRPLRVLRDLGVPFELDRPDAGPWAQVGTGDLQPAVYWYASHEATSSGEWSVQEMPLIGRVVAGPEVARFARQLEGRWRPEIPVLDAAGNAYSWLWRSDQGGSILPFDPDGVVDGYRTEGYKNRGVAAGLEALARRTYYAVRPLLPRGPQIALRRAFTRVQEQVLFPRWPVETALHDLCDLVVQRIADAAGAAIPHVGAWPDGHAWALVLTHDVEQAAGRDAIERVRSVETALELRSSWNLVPERYAVPDELVTHLRNAGCEVGVHGLRHDGRDLQSLRMLRRRGPEIRRWAQRWGAVGFRSPASHRVWEWMPLLGFEYDSSSPDTDPYEPMPGGCCSWLPFFNRDLVELPITLPQDHTLFVLLRTDDRVWHEKTAVLRERGGMALLDTHPDYLLDDESLSRYGRFLEAFARDATAWHALPSEVSAWWRRRAATTLVRDHGAWRPVGPGADEASVVMVEPTARTAITAPDDAGWTDGDARVDDPAQRTRHLGRSDVAWS